MQKLHAGLDVADKTTAICVIGEDGTVVFEGQAETTPEAIAAALKPYRRRLKSVGQEAGLKSTWLHKELTRARWPMVSLDARHAHSALRANLNKTDANDALGLATLLARGIFTAAHNKSDDAVHIRTLLVMRESLLRKAIDLRHCILMANKHLGPKAPVKRRRRRSSASETEDAMIAAMAVVQRLGEDVAEEASALGKTIAALARDHPVARRLMTIPGVGPQTAMTFIGAIDDPHRFSSSRNVGAYLGLTPRTKQSGASTTSGGISHRGDRAARKALYLAARSLLVHSKADFSLRRWGLRLEEKKGRKTAIVAIARKLGVLMHHLWITGEEFDPTR